VAEAHPSADGSERLLVRLRDGVTVESVLLARGGVCVSTQAGCAVGCAFCWTGVGGLRRQLSAEEIAAQVVLARRRRPVRRVVFMGMGEPSHNFAAVSEAMEFLAEEGGFARKNLVFSTVGEPRLFERLLTGPVQPALALSLHTTEAEKRARLMPRAPRVEPRLLFGAALDYAERTRHPLQVQWTLLDGVNDGDDEMDRLASWMKPNLSIVNFIPWNAVPGLPFRRPPLDRMRRIARAFHARGLLAKLRRSAGEDVAAACGQLHTYGV
jgi:23S rRNA (adenine2503-C2)-methyltransferase